MRGTASRAGVSGGEDRPARRSRAAPPANVYGSGPLIDAEEALDRALERLRQADPVVVDHMLAVGGRPPLRRHEPGFAGLAAIIVGQHVSTASAGAIFGRLAAQVRPLTAPALAASSDDVLRALGLSLGKIRTLRAAAEAVASGALPLDALGTLPAEEAHRAMVAIPGIGAWTADSVLLFCLGHPDAWPAGDIALQEAARVALALPARPTARELSHLGERWRPHRSVAARLLWSYYRAIKTGRSGMLPADPSTRKVT